jgi:hypothetical protein
MDISVIKMFLGRSPVFKKLSNIFKTKEQRSAITEKDQATARGESYVRVISVNIDKETPSDGYFELEWNQIFVRQLLEAGYAGNTEEEIVDQWFTDLCRNISNEQF